MAKKKNEPVITYTELLNRAYNDLHREVKEWIDRTGGDQEKIKALSVILDPLHDKMNAVKVMYQYETGVNLE